MDQSIREKQGGLAKSLIFALAKALVALSLIPLLAILAFFYLLVGLALHLAVWLRWHPQGNFALFVYSNSPLWQGYIEDHMLPRIEGRAVILNWSERKTWERRFSLPALVFSFFGGGREFNPLAVLFRPLRPARIYRFYKPFREAKQGNMEPLRLMEENFLKNLSKCRALI